MCIIKVKMVFIRTPLCHGMTLQLNIMINVEPRQGVAHDMLNILINNLLRVKSALSQEITNKRIYSILRSCLTLPKFSFKICS
jgi:hypothetical protein